MWPPGVGLLARMATEDLSIGPYKIKKGDCLGTNFIGLMSNPKYFKEPGTFNPERWNEKSMTNFEPYSFIPFSAGSRSCIGKYLALAEAKLIIIQILQRFDVERTEVPLRMHAPLLY
jgi:cytochrome P450